MSRPDLHRRRRLAAVPLVVASVTSSFACGADEGGESSPPRRSTTSAPGAAVDAGVRTTTTTATGGGSTAPALVPTTVARPRTRPPTPAATGVVVVPYRVEVRTTDAATADFPDVVEATLEDPRGWQRARFDLQRREDAEYVVVIAEGDEVDSLCRPYDTYGKYSCQNGPVVAINADRWRHATPQWTGDLPTYKRMLVNHEVGHLLGQHHPDVQCPRRGEPAPVMAQQSTELDGCLPNPWPLPHEIEYAARHEEPLAPPYERR